VLIAKKKYTAGDKIRAAILFEKRITALNILNNLNHNRQRRVAAATRHLI
jgi:hypothetical protein